MIFGLKNVNIETMWNISVPVQTFFAASKLRPGCAPANISLLVFQVINIGRRQRNELSRDRHSKQRQNVVFAKGCRHKRSRNANDQLQRSTTTDNYDITASTSSNSVFIQALFITIVGLMYTSLFDTRLQKALQKRISHKRSKKSF